MMTPKERPILFSAPLVKALLAGTKSQTRRLVKNAPPDADGCERQVGMDGGEFFRFLRPGRIDPGIRCPFGGRGDRLYVRETWSHDGPDLDSVRATHEDIMGPADGLGYGPYYRATMHPDEAETLVWRPSIHMPKWASRITLEVTGVRVERVQDITEEDAKAEGVMPFPYDPEGDCWTAAEPSQKYRTAFNYLWGEINGWDGPKSWAAGPWCWVVSFKVVR